MRYQVCSGTPFGLHVYETFDTEREALDYQLDKQPFQRIRMYVRPEPEATNDE